MTYVGLRQSVLMLTGFCHCGGRCEGRPGRRSACVREDCPRSTLGHGSWHLALPELRALDARGELAERYPELDMYGLEVHIERPHLRIPHRSIHRSDFVDTRHQRERSRSQRRKSSVAAALQQTASPSVASPSGSQTSQNRLRWTWRRQRSRLRCRQPPLLEVTQQGASPSPRSSPSELGPVEDDDKEVAGIITPDTCEPEPEPVDHDLLIPRGPTEGELATAGLSIAAGSSCHSPFAHVAAGIELTVLCRLLGRKDEVTILENLHNIAGAASFASSTMRAEDSSQAHIEGDPSYSRHAAAKRSKAEHFLEWRQPYLQRHVPGILAPPAEPVDKTAGGAPSLRTPPAMPLGSAERTISEGEKGSAGLNSSGTGFTSPTAHSTPVTPDYRRISIKN